MQVFTFNPHLIPLWHRPFQPSTLYVPLDLKNYKLIKNFKNVKSEGRRFDSPRNNWIFLIDPVLSALASTQPLTKWVPSWGGKERPARKADNLTAMYEPIV
jgi:hypothetical protein